MAKYPRNQLSVAIASSVFACGSILTQFATAAQAAVLTYDFTIDATSLFWGGPSPYIANYNGNFSFDNSSLTGSGDKSVSVLSGVFNYLLPSDAAYNAQTRWSYNFTGTPNSENGEYYFTQVSGGVVNVRSGKLARLSFSGIALESLFQLTWSIDNNKFVSHRKIMGRADAGAQTATVRYLGPEIVVSEPVSKPTTIAGRILGLTSIVAIKKRKKIASN